MAAIVRSFPKWLDGTIRRLVRAQDADESRSRIRYAGAEKAGHVIIEQESCANSCRWLTFCKRSHSSASAQLHDQAGKLRIIRLLPSKFFSQSQRFGVAPQL